MNYTQIESVRIALIQGRDQGSPQANLDYTIKRIRDASSQGAQVICTQELFTAPCFLPSRALVLQNYFIGISRLKLVVVMTDYVEWGFLVLSFVSFTPIPLPTCSSTSSILAIAVVAATQ